MINFCDMLDNKHWRFMFEYSNLFDFSNIIEHFRTKFESNKFELFKFIRTSNKIFDIYSNLFDYLFDYSNLFEFSNKFEHFQIFVQHFVWFMSYFTHFVQIFIRICSIFCSNNCSNIRTFYICSIEFVRLFEQMVNIWIDSIRICSNTKRQCL